MILKNLCLGQSEVNINRLINESKGELLPIVLDIMNGAMSWIEEMICCELVQFLMVYGQGMKPWADLAETRGLNVIQCLIKICVNCMKLPFFNETMTPYQADIVKMYEAVVNDPQKVSCHEDLCIYVKSRYSEQNELTQSLHAMAVHCRTEIVDFLLTLSLNNQNSNEFASKLLAPIPAVFWKRLLQISMMTMRQGTV